MEPLATYRESGDGLRRQFALFQDKVVIHGQRFSGSEFETHVPLSQLDPGIGILRFRSRRCVAGLMLFFAFMFFLWVFLGPLALPINSTRVIVDVGLATACLVWSTIYFPKRTAYRFVNMGGLHVLDVIESGPESNRCRAFADQISDAIRKARQQPMV